MHWPIPLDTKPSIVQMGVGVHGVRSLIETYLLPQLWCVHLYRYHGELLINDTPTIIQPGTASVIPPGITMRYRFRTRSEHLFAHFTLPHGNQPVTHIPAAQDTGADFASLNVVLEKAIGIFQTNRLRAEVALWDLLWDLATRNNRIAPTATPHPAVVEAQRYIELNLSSVIYIPALAKMLGFSQNHLTRLFVAATGTTITTYIRERRLKRAVHLLRHSTLSIKMIATKVGIPDPHLFNKQFRRQTGRCPSAMRQ